jgi:hypothetical protein
MSQTNLSTLTDIFQEIQETFETDVLKSSDDFWNSLTPDQQLDAFCAVVKRIKQGELVEGRSYRGVLYSTFGFGPEAYGMAQVAGYLDIHNALVIPVDKEDQ